MSLTKQDACAVQLFTKNVPYIIPELLGSHLGGFYMSLTKQDACAVPLFSFVTALVRGFSTRLRSSE